MVYATILVRFFIFLSPGRLIKKVWRDVMDRHFVLVIMLILIINSTYFIVRGAPGPLGVNVPLRLIRGTQAGSGWLAGSDLWNHCMD